MDAKQTALATIVGLGSLAFLVSTCTEEKVDSHDVEHAASVGHSAPAHALKADGHAPSHSTAHAAHWAYEGDGGPWSWGELKSEYATCGTGKSQSPIDISPVMLTTLSDIEFNYKTSPLEITNNGHTIQVNYAAGSYITVADKRYDLLQFHFHSPSEHTVGGKAYDMVAHLVHKAADGQLGVVGVMFKAGDKVNNTIAKLWLNMPITAGVTTAVASVQVNAADLLPVDSTYFNYSGSLTTPPCSEGVNWMVLATPQMLAVDQVKQFTNLFPLSTRPVQPLNGRTVEASN